MDEPGFKLKNANIAIIGLGLMGGSLAFSLKDRCRRLSALDVDLPTLEFARQQKIVHYAGSDPVEILADADLVILACPVPAIVDWINRLPGFIQHPCIVLDIGSSKGGYCCGNGCPSRKLRSAWRPCHLRKRTALFKRMLNALYSRMRPLCLPRCRGQAVMPEARRCKLLRLLARLPYGSVPKPTTAFWPSPATCLICFHRLCA